MKAISVLQPFAGLIGMDHKPLESRSRRLNFRGDILICSSAKVHQGYLLQGDDDIRAEKFLKDQIKNLQDFQDFEVLEFYGLGKMICVVQVVGCRPMTVADEQKTWCRLYPGAYVWEFTNIRPVEQVAVTGHRGFYEVDDSLIKYL